MRQFISIIRPAERYETAAALVTIFMVMTAHALLETARDTLFLSNLPPRNLPWVYLAIAALAVISGPLLSSSGSERVNQRALLYMQLTAAAGTGAFLFLTRAPQAITLYALYLWGGVAAAIILVRFWLILGDRFTASQAKRLFPIIASGAVFGSLAGYAIAGVAAAWHDPRMLLAGSAAGFLLSAAAAFIWQRSARADESVDAPEDQVSGRPHPADRGAFERAQNAASATRHPYVRRVALLLLLASVSVTLCDYVFKSVVFHSLARRQIGSFLATVYFSCDLISLILLLVAVGPFVRLVGVPQALALRPLLLAAGGALLTATGGLAAAVALRGVDGSLRWSVHKTATELLYVPMSPRLRCAVKEVSDLVAQRGGQAIGSVLILVALSFADSERWLGPLLIACAGAWIALALSLRSPYLNLFHETLDETSLETRLDFPELDVASLETLMAALNSPEDDRVIAAIDLLGVTGRVHVIPALILYHPSIRVVVRALELFANARRADVVPFSRRLLMHSDAAVRAAAIRASARVEPDAAVLRVAADSSCPIVAATATIVRAARDPATAASALETIRKQLNEAERVGTPAASYVARTLRDFPLPAFAPLLLELGHADDVDTRCEVIRAMGALRDEAHLPYLIGLLGERDLREAVRAALVAFGDPALEQLHKALTDFSLPRAVRTHVPRTMSRFGHQRAADLLLNHLLTEPGGMVRYKILRGLGRMRADIPSLRFDASVLERVVDDHLAKILPLLHWRVVLDSGAVERPERQTVGRQLLSDLLRQKETLAIERLFRVLGLTFPGIDVGQLYEALHGPDAAARASAREVLDHVLPVRWRAPVIGLTDEIPDSERLAAGKRCYAAEDIDYDRLVADLSADRSDIVAALASYHGVEIGLTGADRQDDRAWFEASSVAGMYQNALERLRVRRQHPRLSLRHVG